jgi:hypothetical protein
MKMSTQMYECDGIIARRLAQVHPLNLSQMRTQLLLVLAGTTGIGPEDRVFAELAVVRDVDELAGVNWEGLHDGISVASRLQEQACWVLVEQVRLFAERCVLHHCLCLSRSATTLWLKNTWPIHPNELPNELRPVYEEFAQRLAEADAALQSGRACLHAFQRQVLVQRSIRTLQDLLTRANACYADYLQALDLADQQARYILWYLSEIQEDAAEEARATQRPARHVA